MSSAKLGIFVATMTGTAEICAQEIATAAESAGLLAEVRLMDQQDASALSGYEYVVIVSSTYGHGDIPDNGQAFYDSIAALQGAISVRFAVFGLGDRTYASTFCAASTKWDALLASKGGSHFAPLLQHDASSGTLAEDIAGEWATGWAAQLRKAA